VLNFLDAQRKQLRAAIRFNSSRGAQHTPYGQPVVSGPGPGSSDDYRQANRRRSR
jgi:hypothetical protein